MFGEQNIPADSMPLKSLFFSLSISYKLCNYSVIIIINKFSSYFISDLVPREIVDKWLKYLRNEFPTVAFKASTQNQKQNLVSKFLTNHV